MAAAVEEDWESAVGTLSLVSPPPSPALWYRGLMVHLVARVRADEQPGLERQSTGG